MKNLKIYLYLLIALLLLAACSGGGQTAVEPSTSDTTQTTTTDDEMMAESMDNEEMADTSGNESMDEEHMMDESMDNEEMADASTNESMDDNMAMNEHDEGMADMEETTEAMDNMAEEMDDTTMSDAASWMNIELTDVRSGETFTLADFVGKTVYVEPMATWCTNCRHQLGNVSQAKAQLGDSEDVVFVSLSVETNISNDDLANYTDETGFQWTFAVATPEMLVSLADTFGQSITNPPSTPHFIIRPDGSTTDLTTGYEDADVILQNLEAASQG